MFDEQLEKINQLLDSTDSSNKDVAYQLLLGLGWDDMDAQLQVYKEVDFTKSDTLYLSGYSTDVSDDIMNKYAFKGWDNCMGRASLFIINNWTFLVSEDPGDDYRSSLGDVKVIGKDLTICKNTFKPIRVYFKKGIESTGSWSEDNRYNRFISKYKNLTILEYGTGNYNDYYPYYICNFDIKNLNKVIKNDRKD